MLQQTTRDWDKSVEVKQQVIDYFSRTPALQISIKLKHRKWVPDRQYQTEKSSTTLPVGFSCPVYENIKVTEDRKGDNCNYLVVQAGEWKSKWSEIA